MMQWYGQEPPIGPEADAYENVRRGFPMVGTDRPIDAEDYLRYHDGPFELGIAREGYGYVFGFDALLERQRQSELHEQLMSLADGSQLVDDHIDELDSEPSTPSPAVVPEYWVDTLIELKQGGERDRVSLGWVESEITPQTAFSDYWTKVNPLMEVCGGYIAGEVGLRDVLAKARELEVQFARKASGIETGAGAELEQEQITRFKTAMIDEGPAVERFAAGIQQNVEEALSGAREEYEDVIFWEDEIVDEATYRRMKEDSLIVEKLCEAFGVSSLDEVDEDFAVQYVDKVYAALRALE